MATGYFQSPFTYQVSYQNPVVARQPYSYRNSVNAQGQTPYSYRSPFTYNATGRSPFTYDARQPVIYRNPTNAQTPFTYDARQPVIYRHPGLSLIHI